MNDWHSTILHYYQILQTAVQVVKVLGKIRKIMPKEYSVEEIKENMQSGELHFGDKITVLGTFSEYLPFVDPKFILKEAKSLPRALPRTARLDAIDDTYCGALLQLDQDDAFAKEVLPIFYGIDSKMLEHSTGEMLEIECKITQVPMAYKEVINQNEYFTFEKEEGFVIPFGLKVLGVEPYGLIDSFKVNAWLVGNLSPAPHYKTNKKERSCLNCYNLFSYMAIEPLDFPLKYGCLNYGDPNSDAPESLKKQSKEFVDLEEATPHVVFPKLFGLYEVFYPMVDIFNDDQRKHSTDILLGAIQQNMEILFQGGPFAEGIEIPKESAISVDFQYDQLNKITRQTFDPTKVPKWTCPHYEPSPEWLRKLTKLEKTQEQVDRERFKLKKRF